MTGASDEENNAGLRSGGYSGKVLIGTDLDSFQEEIPEMDRAMTIDFSGRVSYVT